MGKQWTSMLLWMTINLLEDANAAINNLEIWLAVGLQAIFL